MIPNRENNVVFELSATSAFDPALEFFSDFIVHFGGFQKNKIAPAALGGSTPCQLLQALYTPISGCITVIQLYNRYTVKVGWGV